jgi:hypothetical protein
MPIYRVLIAAQANKAIVFSKSRLAPSQFVEYINLSGILWIFWPVPAFYCGIQRSSTYLPNTPISSLLGRSS